MRTISTYMDESGKFLDSQVVSLGAVVAIERQHIDAFANEWAYLLKEVGLEVLEMKEALKAYRPLSAKNEAFGANDRIAALLPFVLCTRKYLSIITGVAIDVSEFSRLPEQYRKVWSDDPHYTAFARNVLQIIDDAPRDGLINLICDDEEKTAWPMYELYRKVKAQYADARAKLRGITFADDRFSFGLQAADLVASLIRQEALLLFRDKSYQYRPLFEALTSQPRAGEQVFKCGVAWCDAEQLSNIGERYKSAKLEKGVVKLTDLSESAPRHTEHS